MVFNAVLLVEETEVPGENHWLVADHWKSELIYNLSLSKLFSNKFREFNYKDAQSLLKISLC
jgi:hypothetical protein